ncbi:MAG TPA: phosphatase PAP2 family protein, partial [Bacteroidia bacterium]
MNKIAFIILLMLSPLLRKGVGVGIAQNSDVKLLSNIYADSSLSKDKAAKIFSGSVAPISIINPAAILIIGLIKKDSLLIHNGIKTTGSLVLNIIVSTGLKYAVNRPRPYAEYPLLFHAKEKTGKYSFPSAHTSFAFANATSLSLAYPKWYVIAPSYLWACGVAYSRMYMGVHYPSDVIAGALIGTACSFLSFKLEK